MRRALLVSCLLAAMTLPVYAFAGVQITNTVEGAWNTDNDNGCPTCQPYDDNYGYLVNKLNLVGSAGDISTWIRIDAWRYFRRPTVFYKGKLLPERLQISYKMGDFKLTVGDFYKQLGRGLVLSYRKGDEVSADTAMRGAELVYSASGHKAIAFGGYRNQANFDPVTKLYLEDSNDALVGLQYEYQNFESFNIGLHGLFNQPEARFSDSYKVDGEFIDYSYFENYLSGGLYVDAPELTDWLSIYAESNVQRRYRNPGKLASVDVFGESEIQEGNRSNFTHGSYASLSMYLGDFQFISEFIHLDGLYLGDIRPPTLVRLQDEIAAVNEVTGGSARLEYYIEDYELTVSANSSYRLNGADRNIHELLGYGAVEWSYDMGRSRLKAEFGYWNTKADGELIKDKAFLYADWVQHVSGKWSVQTITDTEYRMHEDYIRGSTYLTLLKSGLGDITFEFGHDRDQNDSDGETGEMQLFYAGTISVDVIDGWKIRGTGGSQRGGLKCIAGICRLFPPFTGGRLEVVSRF